MIEHYDNKPIEQFVRENQHLLRKITSVKSMHSDLIPTASEVGQWGDVWEFIAQGGDLDTTGQDGNTALHFAIIHQDVEVVAALLNKGANPNIQNAHGHTPLSLCLQSQENIDVAFLLLAHGAIPCSYSPGNYTDLHLAVRWNNPALLQELIEHGADMNKADRSGPKLLFEARVNKANRIVKFIQDQNPWWQRFFKFTNR